MISLPTVPNEQLLALVVGVLVGAMLVKLNHYMAEYRRGRRLETAYADLIALATILEAMHLELERLDYDRERVVSEVKEKLDEDDDVRAAFESSEFVKHLAGKYGDEQNSTR